MGQVVVAWADSKKHKHDGFKTRAERDAVVKQLRTEGWTVIVKKWNVFGEDWFTYEAVKER